MSLPHAEEPPPASVVLVAVDASEEGVQVTCTWCGLLIAKDRFGKWHAIAADDPWRCRESPTGGVHVPQPEGWQYGDAPRFGADENDLDEIPEG